MTTPHTQSAEKMNANPHALLSVVALAVGLLLFAPATARAAFSYTTAAGNGADAQVYLGTDDEGQQCSGKNYGNFAYPGVKTYNADWSMKSYLRFDTTGLVGTAVSASLNLDFVATDSLSVINVFGLKNNATGQGWGESTITYLNAPANDLTPTGAGGTYTTPGTGGATTDAVFLGTYAVINGHCTFSNTDLVSFINADTDHLVTFILTPTSDKNVQFLTKEVGPNTADYPTLSVTIPEPASALILLAGAGSLALGRRRRSCR